MLLSTCPHFNTSAVSQTEMLPVLCEAAGFYIHILKSISILSNRYKLFWDSVECSGQKLGFKDQPYVSNSSYTICWLGDREKLTFILYLFPDLRKQKYESDIKWNDTHVTWCMGSCKHAVSLSYSSRCYWSPTHIPFLFIPSILGLFMKNICDSA